MKDYANVFFCNIIVLRMKFKRMYHLSYISFQKLYMKEFKCVSITLPKFELLVAVFRYTTNNIITYGKSLSQNHLVYQPIVYR